VQVPVPFEDERATSIEHALELISGQICRCTGYATIVRSTRWAAEHSNQEVSG
jgi:aerobic-type carbon monoxide dehydrogenase small subunit (CoxS/CutS family)